MAVWSLQTSANLSTPGTAWKRVEAKDLTITQSGTPVDLNTARTIPVTFSNAGNQVGIVLMFRVTVNSSTNITIKLQENVASVWTDRTTDTIAFDATNFPDSTTTKYVPLTSYAVTTAASTWRYQISFGGGTGNAGLVQNSAATSYFYAVVLDASSAGPTSGDTIILTNSQTLTIDQSFTLGATDSTSAVFCHDSSITWAAAPAASYTLTVNARWTIGGSGNLTIGSSGSRISAANKAIIDLASTGTYLLHGIYYYQSGTDMNFYIKCYGATSTNIRKKVTANANSGQPVIVTETDMSAIWSVGDNVTLYGKNKTSTDDIAYTISSMSGTSITLSANLDQTLYSGGAIVNRSESADIGVHFKNATTGQSLSNAQTRLGYVELDGVYAENFGFYQTGFFKSGVACTYKNILLYSTGGHETLGSPFTADSAANIDNVHEFRSTSQYVKGIFLTGLLGGTINNVTIKGKHQQYGGSAQFYVNGTGVTISDVISAHSINASGYANAIISGSKNIVSGCLFIGGYLVLYMTNAVDSTFSSVKVEKGGAYGLYLAGGVVNAQFSSCSFGSVATSATNDVYCASSTYNTVLNDTTSIGAGGVGNIINAVDGSFIKFHKYNATNNDHRTFFVYGNLYSTGDGLSDTTVHTSGTNYFGVNLISTSSSNTFDDWSFTIPTGNIQGKTMFVGVWCNINSATYYAGTYQLPRLSINYDNGTTTYVAATATAGWQFLSLPFIPTTTFGQITATFSAKTDATGSNAYVYFDDFKTLFPAETPLDTQGLDLWADALPVTPPLATVLSANDVWAAPSTVDYGANTMGKQLAKKVLTLAKFLGLK